VRERDFSTEARAQQARFLVFAGVERRHGSRALVAWIEKRWEDVVASLACFWVECCATQRASVGVAEYNATSLITSNNNQAASSVVDSFFNKSLSTSLPAKADLIHSSATAAGA
jgi:hypothetical protein